MKYKIEFQYMGPDDTRPQDYVQEEEIVFEAGEAIPVPVVGDTVSCRLNGKREAFKVLSRHFSYAMGWCVVNIVVTDVGDGEMARRLKE